MVNSARQQSDFKSFLKEQLTYEYLSNIEMQGYKDLFFEIFDRLDLLKREENIDFDSVRAFIIGDLFPVVMGTADESDILFERRFTAITEELIGFCADPIFWNVSYAEYKKKLHVMTASKWYWEV